MRRRQPDPIEVQQMRQEANQRKQEASNRFMTTLFHAASIYILHL